MNPTDITPAYRVQSTVSHPARPEQVIGFVGRNTKLGRHALIMKGEAIEAETVLVPEESSERLIKGRGELAILDGDEVLVMEAPDFARECHSQEVEGRNKTLMMNAIDRDSDSFTVWSETEVEVGN